MANKRTRAVRWTRDAKADGARFVFQLPDGTEFPLSSIEAPGGFEAGQEITCEVSVPDLQPGLGLGLLLGAQRARSNTTIKATAARLAKTRRFRSGIEADFSAGRSCEQAWRHHRSLAGDEALSRSTVRRIHREWRQSTKDRGQPTIDPGDT